MPPMEVSRTLILIKPDAIQRGLTGEIIKRFERKGFRIIRAEMRFIDEDFAGVHYEEHKHNTPYFAKMIEAITHGPVIAMILEGINAPENSRQLIGNANPHSSAVGTIRGDLAYEEAFNLVHGSDSAHSAYREIALWFSDQDYWPEGYDPKKKKKWEQKFNPAKYILANKGKEDIYDLVQSDNTGHGHKFPDMTYAPMPDLDYETDYEPEEVF
jgi:nucleoside-diphosphate kinase